MIKNTDVTVRRRKVLQLIEAGLTMVQVARVLADHNSTISNDVTILRRQGHTVNTPGKTNYLKALRYYLANRPHMEIKEYRRLGEVLEVPRIEAAYELVRTTAVQIRCPWMWREDDPIRRFMRDIFGRGTGQADHIWQRVMLDIQDNMHWDTLTEVTPDLIISTLQCEVSLYAREHIVSATRTDVEAYVVSIIREARNDRQAYMLCMFYGLGGHRRHSLDELAHTFGMNREPVRKGVVKSLRELKHPEYRERIRRAFNGTTINIVGAFDDDINTSAE